MAKLTAADAGQRAAELLGGARRGDGLTKEQRKEKGRQDLIWFGRYYLPEHFSAEPAGFHHELAEIVKTRPRGAPAAPREHAKSTVMSLALPLQVICNRLRRFIVLIRDADDVAAAAVDEIRDELETNERIREDYGNLVGDRKWAEDEFVTKNGVKVVGVGRGKRGLRGMRFGPFRPGLMILDDVEDEESTESKAQRKKTRTWFLRTVSNAVGPGGQIIVLGTILHPESLLAWLHKSRADVYYTKIWRAIDEKTGKLLWPAVWPKDRLDAKKHEIGSRAFEQEFQNNPGSEEDRIFDPAWWGYFDDSDVEDLVFTIVGAIDPAIGQKKRNDETAATIWGTANGNFYCLWMQMKKIRFTAQVELAGRMAREWPLMSKLGVESIAYQEALHQAAQDYSAKHGLQIPLTPLESHKVDKLSRISRLAPLAEQGRIYFPKAGSSFWTPSVSRCIEQFEQLGQSANAHDDGPDSCEMAIGLLRGASSRKGRVRMVRRAA